jgi:hypothetical protein
MIATLLTFFAVGLATLIAIGLALAAIGIDFSLAWGIATLTHLKDAPIVLVGWVILKLFDRRKSKGELSAADREWLESGR